MESTKPPSFFPFPGEIVAVTPDAGTVGPIPPEPPKPRRPLRDWYERQPPAVRAALVLLAATVLNQSAPWLMPLFRVIAGGAAGQ
jgi:hypothetical protein